MRKLLQTRLEAAGIAATAEQLDKLCAFHALLTQANARMNLTRVPDDPAEAIDRNYLDSLAPLAHLRGAETCVDVGSGAGFPGVSPGDVTVLTIWLEKRRRERAACQK